MCAVLEIKPTSDKLKEKKTITEYTYPAGLKEKQKGKERYIDFQPVSAIWIAGA